MIQIYYYKFIRVGLKFFDYDNLIYYYKYYLYMFCDCLMLYFKNILFMYYDLILLWEYI